MQDRLETSAEGWKIQCPDELPRWDLYVARLVLCGNARRQVFRDTSHLAHTHTSTGDFEDEIRKVLAPTLQDLPYRMNIRNFNDALFPFWRQLLYDRERGRSQACIACNGACSNVLASTTVDNLGPPCFERKFICTGVWKDRYDRDRREYEELKIVSTFCTEEVETNFQVRYVV